MDNTYIDNYEFLKKDCKTLYNHASKMESYLFNDPDAAIMHGNKLFENLLNQIYSREGESHSGLNNVEKIDYLYNNRIIPENIRKSLHIARKERNKGLHETANKKGISKFDKNMIVVARWFHDKYYNKTGIIVNNTKEDGIERIILKKTKTTLLLKETITKNGKTTVKTMEIENENVDGIYQKGDLYGDAVTHRITSKNIPKLKY